MKITIRKNLKMKMFSTVQICVRSRRRREKIPHAVRDPGKTKKKENNYRRIYVNSESFTAIYWEINLFYDTRKMRKMSILKIFFSPTILFSTLYYDFF